MKHTIIEFPQITVHRYQSPMFNGDLFHLYVNGEYEGAYMDEESLLSRLAMLCFDESRKEGVQVCLFPEKGMN